MIVELEGEQEPQEMGNFDTIIYEFDYNHSTIRETISTSENSTNLLITIPKLFL